MSNLSFRLALLLLTLPAGVAAQPAAAQPVAAQPANPPPSQVSLHYVDEPGCPTEAEFVAEVTARVRRPVQWSATGAALQMVVIVRRAGEHADGTLEVVQRATEPTRREFTSSSCAEVGSALALVAALTLDPNARTEQLPAHAPSAAPNAPTLEVVPAPQIPLAPPTAPAPRPARLPPAESAAAPPARSSGGGYVAWLGPTAGVAAGYASEALVVTGLSLGVRSARDGLAPGFQLTPLWGKTGTIGPAAAGGTFSWALARFDACPARFALAPRLSFEPCAAAEIGSVSARGAGVAITPVAVERWWFAAGVTLSLHLSLGPWFARLAGLGLVPVTRDEFVFHDPNRTIHQANVVLVGASLGLGFQFGS